MTMLSSIESAKDEPYSADVREMEDGKPHWIGLTVRKGRATLYLDGQLLVTSHSDSNALTWLITGSRSDSMEEEEFDEDEEEEEVDEPEEDEPDDERARA